MNKLDVVQVGFFMPVLTEMAEAGVNVGYLLKSSGLNKFKLDDPNRYVPVELMYDFFTEIHHQQGIDDLARQCEKKIKVASLSQWGELVTYSPDLLSAFQFGVKNSQVALSHEQFELSINGTTTTFKQRFSDASNLGRDQTDLIAFSLLIKAVQLALGHNWVPLEIHMQSNAMPNLDVLFASGCDADVLLGQPATAIKLPTALLTSPMSTANVASKLENDFASTGPLSARVERLLDAKHDELHANINLLAEMTSLSTRTLQRNLAKEDTSVSDVIQQWRFKKSLELLENANINIKEISEILGYNEVSNFNRAFRRWTNTTPSRYRDEL